jgi:hypothetical protein
MSCGGVSTAPCQRLSDRYKSSLWIEKNPLFFPHSQLMVSCLQSLCFHFMARLRRNSFAIIVTAFVLTPLGRAWIPGLNRVFDPSVKK